MRRESPNSRSTPRLTLTVRLDVKDPYCIISFIGRPQMGQSSPYWIEARTAFPWRQTRPGGRPRRGLFSASNVLFLFFFFFFLSNRNLLRIPGMVVFTSPPGRRNQHCRKSLRNHKHYHFKSKRFQL